MQHAQTQQRGVDPLGVAVHESLEHRAHLWRQLGHHPSCGTSEVLSEAQHLRPRLAQPHHWHAKMRRPGAAAVASRPASAGARRLADRPRTSTDRAALRMWGRRSRPAAR